MIKLTKLDCGVRLVSEEIPYVRSVSMGIWVRAGAVDEDPSVSGISHFIEHMLFKGTEKRTAKQIAEDTDRIAGQMNAFTGREATCYYLKTLSSNMEKGAEILLDMFMNSKFETEEMNRERNVIFEEMKMIEDTPDDDIHDIISELVFQGNPLAKSIIGTRDTLSFIDRERIMEYRSKKYAQDSVVIAVAGNFDEDTVCSIFNDAFAELPKTKEIISCGNEAYSPRYRSKVKDIEQSHICLATRGIKREDERYSSLAILNNIMGGTMSSRLFQSIREEKGLAYSVYSSSASFNDMGYYNIYAGVSHDKIEETIQAVKAELALLKKDGISRDELEMSREQLKGSYIFGQENVNTRMFSMGRNMTLYNKIYTPDEVIGELDSVSFDDIYRATDVIVDFDNYCGAVISNKDVPVSGYIKE